MIIWILHFGTKNSYELETVSSKTRIRNDGFKGLNFNIKSIFKYLEIGIFFKLTLNQSIQLLYIKMMIRIENNAGFQS